MPAFVQFGDVILNVDQVVKVERKGDATSISVVGFTDEIPPESVPAVNVAMLRQQLTRRPGVITLHDEYAAAAWKFFTELAKA